MHCYLKVQVFAGSTRFPFHTTSRSLAAGVMACTEMQQGATTGHGVFSRARIADALLLLPPRAVGAVRHSGSHVHPIRHCGR
jgi:hypothetical protein